MPRSSNGTYTLPIGAFTPGTTIKSSDMNSDLGDMATALTQSLATTGVSLMTGPLFLSSGSLGAPGLSWAQAQATGIFLLGVNQMAWSANGVQAATFNADGSVNWAGTQIYAGSSTFNGASTFAGADTHNATSTFTSAITFSGNTFSFSGGASANFWSALGQETAVVWSADGGGNTIATGFRMPAILIPFGFTVTGWSMFSNAATSTTARCLLAGAVTTPYSGSFIDNGSNEPALSSASGKTSTTLGGWTTSFATGNVFTWDIISNSAATILACQLNITRTTSS
jgi:hypothetical protein